MAEALIAAVPLAVAILVPLLVGDPVLRGAWIAADTAALLAMAAALPLALGLWVSSGRVRAGLGFVVAVAAIAGLARDPAVPAQAALGLPVIVLALLARMRAVPPAALQLAAANGVSPATQWRHVMAPLMMPGLAAGGLIVFAAVLASGLRAAPSALDWALPVASMTAWMMSMLPARR